jgi:hypothetical protein
MAASDENRDGLIPALETVPVAPVFVVAVFCSETNSVLAISN